MSPILFTQEEKDIIRCCQTPEATQRFLDSLKYNFEEDGVETLRSFRRVVRDRTAHCLDGALAAAEILSHHGYAPRILCMEASDIDHSLFVYRVHGKWGSVAQSRDENLKAREPSFQSLRDLVMSYYPYYYNEFTKDKNDLTLRGYTLVDLRTVEGERVMNESDLTFVEQRLYRAKYKSLFPSRGKHIYTSDREGTVTWIS